MLSPSKLLGSSHHPGSYGSLSFIGRFLLKPGSSLSLPQTSSCPNLALKENVPCLAWSFLGLLVTAGLLLKGSTPLLPALCCYCHCDPSHALSGRPPKGVLSCLSRVPSVTKWNWVFHAFQSCLLPSYVSCVCKGKHVCGFSCHPGCTACSPSSMLAPVFLSDKS